jgi:hypothetical protein
MAKIAEAPLVIDVAADSEASAAATPTPVPVSPAPEAQADRYFKLSKPIEVGGRVKQKMEQLLVDVTELEGTVYFELTDRYAAEFPQQYQQSFTRFRDERFLKLLLVKLNPPMIDEDVKKISFKDLPLLFTRLQASIFAR